MGKIGQAIIELYDNPKDFFRLIEYNTHFEQLTSLSVDMENSISEIAFGERAQEYYQDYCDFLSGDGEEYYIHLYLTSDKWLYTIMEKAEKSNQIELQVFDVTKYQKELERLKLKELGYVNFVENSHGMAFQRMLKPKVMNLFTAGCFENIVGYSSEIGESTTSWLEHIHPDDLEWVKSESEHLFGEIGYNKEYDYRIIRKDNAVRWIRTYDSNFYSSDGQYQMVQGIMFDITDFKVQEAELKNAYDTIIDQNMQLEKLSRTDPLTQLHSRRSIQLCANSLIEKTDENESFIMMLIDIDDFKVINDNYGHLAGDYILQEFSKTMLEELRGLDFCGRWGGEEFMVLLPSTTLKQGIEMANRLLDVMTSQVFKFEGVQIHISFTAGLSESQQSKTFRQMYSEADKALYQGKSSGKKKVVY